jgi:hypothetical protein
MYVHEIHAYEVHAYEVYPHEMHARKMHAREMHARKVRGLCARCTPVEFLAFGKSSLYSTVRQRESNEVPLMITRRRGSWLPLLQVAGLLRLWEISKSENLKIFSFWEKFPIPHRRALK